MDEYIKREDAIKLLEDSDIGFCDDEPIQTRNRALKIIQNIPAADVRPVVLCKDCKYSDSNCIVKEMIWCNMKGSPDYTVRKDFFCAHGKRKDTREVEDGKKE